MPGTHMPPAMPVHPGRRPNDYHYMQQQGHSPAQRVPYAGYHPQYHAHPPPPQYAQPWYPPYQQQYSVPPRHFQQHQHQHQQHQQQQQPPPPPPPLPPPQHQHHSPLVVSSPPGQPMSNPPRQNGFTPPVAPSQTPQPAPSTPSTQFQSLASPTTPTAAANGTPPPSTSRPTSSSAPPQPPVARRMPFYPQLPWLSVPEAPFPPRAARQRRRRRDAPAPGEALELPSRDVTNDGEGADGHLEPGSQTSTLAAPSDLETPPTSHAPSEADSTHPTTPASSAPPPSTPRAQPTVTNPRTATRAAVPIVPITPIVPKVATSSDKPTSGDGPQSPRASDPEAAKAADAAAADTTAAESAPAPTPPKPAPKSWADLVRVKAPTNASAAAITAGGEASAKDSVGAKAGSLTDVLHSFNVDSGSKVAFLEPRGLVNTGNMCYMNSILQVLVFCIPFYDFLDQVGKRAVHSFKSETPLVDAMIMFMREFSVIDSTVSVEQLRLRLKDQELEQYGEAFIPEFVYEVIKRLPRFSTMRRGHQQDAEEFLGFLLEGLHDECVSSMKSRPSPASPTESSSTADTHQDETGWLEVGPKQKPSITRSSGFASADSPITKIFGGKLRSELRVPGLKPSVTLEPYQPLQLDIGSPQIHSITDALKGLTRPETLQGDFNSPRGPGVSATKQVFIDTLPPVLILHLKRFQYDNAGGTQKIWKRIGYPLELELPREVFPPAKRASLFPTTTPTSSSTTGPGRGPPRYRLISVVYHHGKNASGGHYTVDVRRQDGREWIRLDDTLIRRVRSDDVAHAGAEDPAAAAAAGDPRALAAALERHRREPSAGRNMFEQVADEDDESREGGVEGDAEGAGGGWSQTNGPTAAGGRKWTGVINGTATPGSAGRSTPRAGRGQADKVAYILFYEQIKW